MARKQTIAEFQQPPAQEIVIMAEALSEVEASELVQHEKTISRGLHTFIEVGEALQHIRDKRLYRTEFETFEGYCKLKWGMGRQYAYRLIGGAEVAGNLVSSIGDTALPQREAHTRELAKLAPEAQSIAWLKAVEKAGSVEAVTADVVSWAVDVVLGKAGRFDNDLWYALDYDRNEIYEPGEKKYSGNDPKHPLKDFQWQSGSQLNTNKRYDAFKIVPIPVLNDVPPIEVMLPRTNWKAPTTDGLCYPVDSKNRVIYNDPVPYEERGEKRYAGCIFHSEYNIAAGWASLRHRYYEYRIADPLPLLDWVQDAHLKPGMFARCQKCVVDYPFAEVVAGLHGEFWVCPHGHSNNDAEWNAMEKQYWLPKGAVNPPVEPPKPDAPPTVEDEDEGEDARMAEMGEVYAAVVQFDEFLTTLRDNLDDFNELLNLRTDILEEFRHQDEWVEDGTLELARNLLQALKAEQDDQV